MSKYPHVMYNKKVTLELYENYGYRKKGDIYEVNDFKENVVWF